MDDSIIKFKQSKKLMVSNKFRKTISSARGKSFYQNKLEKIMDLGNMDLKTNGKEKKIPKKTIRLITAYVWRRQDNIKFIIYMIN